MTFTIKSMMVQNTIMILALGTIVGFFVIALAKKSPRHILISFIWLLGVIWFFNSPFFGFSRVSVDPQGIRIDYGVLSFKNTTVPLGTPWEVESHISGIRRMKRVYTLRIGQYRSMRVKSREDLAMLKEIGKTIDRMKKSIQGENWG